MFCSSFLLICSGTSAEILDVGMLGFIVCWVYLVMLAMFWIFVVVFLKEIWDDWMDKNAPCSFCNSDFTILYILGGYEWPSLEFFHLQNQTPKRTSSKMLSKFSAKNHKNIIKISNQFTNFIKYSANFLQKTHPAV